LVLVDQSLVRHLDTEQVLRLHCRDLFSRRAKVRETAAESLRVILSLLGTPILTPTDGAPPRASEVEQHSHFFEEVFLKSEQSTGQRSIFDESDIRNFANILLTEQLEISVRQAAAEQLCGILIDWDSKVASLTPALVERLWAAVSGLLSSSGWMASAGSALLLALLWRHRLVRKRVVFHHEDGNLSLQRFLPLLYDSQPLVRACMRACLVSILFDISSWTAATGRSSELVKRELSLIPPSHGTIYSVSCSLGDAEIEPAPTARPASSSGGPITPEYVFALFMLEGVSAEGGYAGSHRWDAYGSLTVSLANPTTPLPSLPSDPAALTRLSLSISDGWNRLNGKSTVTHPGRGLCGPKAGVADNLLSSLKDAGSHRDFSNAMNGLLGWCVSSGQFRLVVVKQDWIKSVARLLQGPPVSKKDDQIFSEALSLFTVLLPEMASYDIAAMISAAVDCILPVLEQAFRKSRRNEDSDSGNYEARPDLVEQGIDFLLLLCRLSPCRDMVAEGMPVVVLARKTPLAHILVDDALNRINDILLPPLSMRAGAAALNLLYCLLPTILDQPTVPLFLSGLGSTILRQASRLHKPDSFQGHTLIREALETLSRALEVLPPSIAKDFWWSVEQNQQGPMPASIFRFIADHDSVVRTLCYRALKAIVRQPSLFVHLCTTDDGQTIQAPPNFFDAVIMLISSRSECPAVRAEAFGVLAAFIDTYRDLSPWTQSESDDGSALTANVFRILSGAKVTSLLTSVAELFSSTSPQSATLKASGLRLLNMLIEMAMDSDDGNDRPWTGLFSLAEGTAAADALGARLLTQLVWQQEIVSNAVKMIGAEQWLRLAHDKMAEEASGLPVNERSLAPGKSPFSTGEVFRQEGGGISRGGWDVVLQHSRTLGDQEACGAQAQAIELVDMLLNWSEQDCGRLLSQTSIIPSTVLCLEAYCQEATKTRRGVMPPRYHISLMERACAVGYNLFLPRPEGSTQAASYIPVPSTIPERLFFALRHILELGDAFKGLMQEVKGSWM